MTDSLALAWYSDDDATVTDLGPVPASRYVLVLAVVDTETGSGGHSVVPVTDRGTLSSAVPTAALRSMLEKTAKGWDQGKA